MRPFLIAMMIAGVSACGSNTDVWGCRNDELTPACAARINRDYTQAYPQETPVDPHVAIANTDFYANEQRARAECSYKAQEANSNSYGLVRGFFAGLGTGSACIEYYQKIGVIR